MEGVVRAPSEFSMTLTLLPSVIATHELVVPRSMPMIFAMFFSGGMKFDGRELWITQSLFKATSARGADRDERRPQHPVGDEVALLQDGHDGVRLLRRRHDA